jgi:hypothetical protein
MAKPTSDGEGQVIVPVEDVNTMIIKATGLGAGFFVSVGKVKVLSDGSLQGNYTFSNSTPPTPPVDA